jgi:hypothetical protein
MYVCKYVYKYVYRRLVSTVQALLSLGLGRFSTNIYLFN